MYAYCLFCETQRCKTVASLLEKRDSVVRAFSPQIINRQRKKGKNLDHSYDLLPGYVFFYVNEKLTDFSLFHGISGIVRRIGNSEDGYALVGGDFDFAMNLLEKNGVVGHVTVFKNGDTVVLADSLFNGCQGKITQIDLRKQRARVDYQFSGMDCFTWVAFDMLSKAPEEK
ncbi:MAG: hypothetical protein IJI53_08760 [Clostridia bacterium]|nr:hypothetical protein [Clostridia bacterium]